MKMRYSFDGSRAGTHTEEFLLRSYYPSDIGNISCHLSEYIEKNLLPANCVIVESTIVEFLEIGQEIEI
jgi:hypothetical protein